MTILLSLLFAIIGLFTYVMATNAKAVELGRIAFACGLLAFLIKAAEPVISIFGR